MTVPQNPNSEAFGEVDARQGMILYLDDLTVSFDGFKALDELCFYLRDGELRCVIGPNGAGKTTMMDVISGKTRPDSGLAFFGSRLDLTQMSEHEIARAGIGRKFQKPTVFPGHTVFENLELALRGNRGLWHTLFAKLSSEQKDRIASGLETVGLSDEAYALAGQLSHGQKQWLEIGMLLVQDPKLLLVDEPVAGLSLGETERTAELLSSLSGSHTVVVVEHDMEFVRQIARTVTVLHEGRVLAEGPMERIQADADVIAVYLGS